MQLLSLTSFVLAGVSIASAFPGFAESLDSRGPKFMGAQPLPSPIKDTSSKLVHDRKHPYIPPKPTDQRGPCPGLNTMANHGYLPRNGIATPAQIITAAQEAFNMGYDLASLITMGGFVITGNHETNLVSIGGKTPLTGPDPPPPAVVVGMSEHGFFEGDTSSTRSDAALGDHIHFNATLFNQLADAAVELGEGKINHAAMAEFRYRRIQDSIARNPSLDLSNPRFLTVYAEGAFTLRFFVNGTTGYLRDGSMPTADVEVARSFFDTNRMPDGFFRREGPYGVDPENKGLAADIDWFFAYHPVAPGRTHGAGNFVPDETIPGLCDAYNSQINSVKKIYPPESTKGNLRKQIKKNLRTFFTTLPLHLDPNCKEAFPYGR